MTLIRSCSLDLDDDYVDDFSLIKSLLAFKWLHYNFSNEAHESAAEGGPFITSPVSRNEVC